MKILRITSAALLAMFAVIFFACQKDMKSPSVTSSGSTKPKVGTPKIECGNATTSSIEIVVTGSPITGAPAGFSIQWVPKSYLAGPDGIYGNGDDLPWPLSEDATNLCKASFSGNASGYYYNLTASGDKSTVTVTIGDILYDNPGASTNCGDGLDCHIQDYAFRAFAHATNTLQRSDFTSTLTCSTKPCPTTDFCSFSQGYWFNAGRGASQHAWPGSLNLGNCTYTEAQGRAIKNYMVQTSSQYGDVRQAFLQAGAIKLSFIQTGKTIPADVQAKLDIIDAFFSNLPCLQATLNADGKTYSGSIPTASDDVVREAAAWLSAWIEANHC